jgi:hypothetical protein
MGRHRLMRERRAYDRARPTTRPAHAAGANRGPSKHCGNSPGGSHRGQEGDLRGGAPAVRISGDPRRGDRDSSTRCSAFGCAGYKFPQSFVGRAHGGWFLGRNLDWSLAAEIWQWQPDLVDARDQYTQVVRDDLAQHFVEPDGVRWVVRAGPVTDGGFYTSITCSFRDATAESDVVGWGGLIE